MKIATPLSAVVVLASCLAACNADVIVGKEKQPSSPGAMGAGGSGSTGTMVATTGATTQSSGANGMSSGANGMSSGSNGMSSGSNGMSSGSNGMSSGANGMSSGSNGMSSGSGSIGPADGVMVRGSAFGGPMSLPPTSSYVIVVPDHPIQNVMEVCANPVPQSCIGPGWWFQDALYTTSAPTPNSYSGNATDYECAISNQCGINGSPFMSNVTISSVDPDGFDTVEFYVPGDPHSQQLSGPLKIYRCF